MNPDYGKATLVWKSPAFLDLLARERNLRDMGIAEAVNELESVKGPLRSLSNELWPKAEELMRRLPDKDDPTALSPKEWVDTYFKLMGQAREVEGKVESVKVRGIAEIMSGLAQKDQITSGMLETAMELLREKRALDDQRLAGVIDG